MIFFPFKIQVSQLLFFLLILNTCNLLKVQLSPLISGSEFQLWLREQTDRYSKYIGYILSGKDE